MIPFIQKPPLTRRQKRLALAVAMVVDFIQLPGFLIFSEGAFSPVEDALDFLTAILLTAICGFKWQFALAFATELVPMLDLFPTWTAVVLTLPVEAPSPTPSHKTTEPQRLNVAARVEAPR